MIRNHHSVFSIKIVSLCDSFTDFKMSETKGNENNPLHWDDIAKKLLQERLLLTALELHTELVEAGHQLPRLTEYFSNPAHFDLYSIKSSSDAPPGVTSSSLCKINVLFIKDLFDIHKNLWNADYFNLIQPKALKQQDKSSCSPKLISNKN